MKRRYSWTAAAVWAAVFFFAVPARAAQTSDESGPAAVSYGKALAMAVAAVSDGMTLQENAALLTEQRDEAQDALDKIHASWRLGNADVTEEERIRQQNAVKTLDRQIEALWLSQSMISIKIELELINALAEWSDREADMGLLTASVALAEENARLTRVRRQHGRSSAAEARAAEQSLARQQAELNALTLTLNNSRQTLNLLLGAAPAADIAVAYERPDEPLPESLDSYIAEALAADPVLRQRQLDVDEAQMALDFRNDRNRKKGIRLDKDKVDTLQQTLDQAQRALTDARDAREEAIRVCHSQLGTLLTQSDALRVDLEKAQDAQHTAQALLKAGQVTSFDVDSARLAALQIETLLEQNANACWRMRFMLAHPFLLG